MYITQCHEFFVILRSPILAVLMLVWISDGLEYVFAFSFSYFSLSLSFFPPKRSENIRTFALNIHVEAISTCLVGASDQSVLCTYLSYCVVWHYIDISIIDFFVVVGFFVVLFVCL